MTAGERMEADITPGHLGVGVLNGIGMSSLAVNWDCIGSVLGDYWQAHGAPGSRLVMEKAGRG